MKIKIAENIKALRKQHSFTQEQLAEALGVTFASVSKWERGAAAPELNLIAKMADFFGVSLDALVGFALQNGSITESGTFQELMDKKGYFYSLFTVSQ